MNLIVYPRNADDKPDYSAGVVCPADVRMLPWQRAGLSYTATGYGPRIPTRYVVHYAGRWRRVYCHIFSNAGTCYIGPSLRDGLIVSEG